MFCLKKNAHTNVCPHILATHCVYKIPQRDFEEDFCGVKRIEDTQKTPKICTPNKNMRKNHILHLHTHTPHRGKHTETHVPLSLPMTAKIPPNSRHVTAAKSQPLSSARAAMECTQRIDSCNYIIHIRRGDEGEGIDRVRKTGEDRWR